MILPAKNYEPVVGGVEMSFPENKRDFPEIFRAEVYFFGLKYNVEILLT